MTQNGVLSVQPQWVPIKEENDSLSWPTPTAANWTTSTSMDAIRKHLQSHTPSSRLVENIALADPLATGYLNPMWAEWLMGFPLGWTDLEA